MALQHVTPVAQSERVGVAGVLARAAGGDGGTTVGKREVSARVQQGREGDRVAGGIAATVASYHSCSC